MIEPHEGSLFDSTAPALAHGVNCRGVMGAGVAAEVKRRAPWVFAMYRERCTQGLLFPGDIFAVRSSQGAFGTVYFNLATQDEPGPNAWLPWVACALTQMFIQMQQLDIRRVAMPRIGCGIGGLNWRDVESTLERLCPQNVTVEVWTLPGSIEQAQERP